jgi:hypothetical protein
MVSWLPLVGAIAGVLVAMTLKGTGSGLDAPTAVLTSVIYVVGVVGISWAIVHFERKRER